MSGLPDPNFELRVKVGEDDGWCWRPVWLDPGSIVRVEAVGPCESMVVLSNTARVACQHSAREVRVRIANALRVK